MSARAGHDLSGIIKWCAREDWRPRVDAVMAEHFEPAMKAFGLDFQEIGEEACWWWRAPLNDKQRRGPVPLNKGKRNGNRRRRMPPRSSQGRVPNKFTGERKLLMWRR